MIRCLKCKNLHVSNCGYKNSCEIDAKPVEYKKKCVFPVWFKKWEAQANKAGYWLSYKKMEGD